MQCITITRYFNNVLHYPLHLKEPLQIPHLEHAVCADNADLEYTPPFDAGVGALGGVSVDHFSGNDVPVVLRQQMAPVFSITGLNSLLLILNLAQHLGQLLYTLLQRITVSVVCNIDNTVDIEQHFLVAGVPVLVGEAVGVPAVEIRVEV